VAGQAVTAVQPAGAEHDGIALPSRFFGDATGDLLVAQGTNAPSAGTPFKRAEDASRTKRSALLHGLECGTRPSISS